VQDGDLTWLQLSLQPGETLRSALARTLRDAIRGGALRPGVRLPSSRSLAAQLRVSRGVASDAYAQLVAQGFLQGREKAAPLVATVGGVVRPHPPRPASRSFRLDLRPGTPDVSLFPIRSWVRALGRAAGSPSRVALDYGSSRGEPELREALADHLGRTRGVATDPDRIVVVNGTAQAAHLLAHALADRGTRRVAVEDPSWNTQAERLQLGGLQVVGQPADQNGLIVEGLDAQAVVVAPAHQFPLGTVMSGARRRSLLDWARHRDALIIEDDYDAEFRYDGLPAPALQGLDPDRVAYMGTASKTLAPGLRLAWLVTPPWLTDEAERVKHLLDFCSPVLEQRALAEFLRHGDYDRHVRRMRLLYMRRRDVLVRAVAAELPDLALEGVAAGIHALLRLPAGCDDQAVAAAAEADEILVAPLSLFGVDRPPGPGLVLGYGRLPASIIPEAIAALGRAIRGARRSGPAGDEKSRL